MDSITTKARMARIRELIDAGGGQACDVEGVIRALSVGGFAVVPIPEPASDEERLEDFKTGEWMVMEQVCPHCGKKPSDGISDEELSGAGGLK